MARNWDNASETVGRTQMEGEDMSKDENGSANARVVVAPGASTPATDQDYAALKTQFDDGVTNKLGAGWPRLPRFQCRW